MTGKITDTIGSGPRSDLPLGVLTPGVAATGWISGSSADEGIDTDDAWALDLTAGQKYTVVYQVTSDLHPIGMFTNDYIVFDISVSEAGVFLQDRVIHDLPLAGGTVPVREFTFTATETNTYYFNVQGPSPGNPDGVPYRLIVSEFDPDAPDPDALPELAAPDDDSLEKALYSGYRVDSRDISYWFAIDGEDGSDGWDAMEQGAAINAMASWAAVADINFTRSVTKTDATWLLVAKDGYEQQGSLDFPEGTQQTGTFDSTYEAWSHSDGDTGLVPGGNGYLTLLHEFGHGLGLAHPHDTGGVSTKLPGVDSEFGDLGDNELNQTLFTVMSYNTGFKHPKAGAPDPVDFGHIHGPSAIDIAVVQRLYGTRDANAGSTIYDLVRENTTGTGFLTIWDTGGMDTIRGLGSTRAFIDLRAATLLEEKGGGGWASFKSGISGGFTIANSVVIENAEGGSGNDVLTGNEFDNQLVGNDGKDKLSGHGGNDILLGGDKTDILAGGIGHDILNGGSGRDYADYRKSLSAVTVDMETGLVTGEGTDTLISIERILGSKFADTMTAGDTSMLFRGKGGDDILTGGSVRDRLEGGGGKDTLTGNGGRDILIGGRNNDTLTGGAGRDGMRGGQGDDTYVFLDLSDSNGPHKRFDLIRGFSDGDLIDLTQIDALTGGDDDAFTFLGTGRFTGAGGELRLQVSGSKTFVLADVDGDKKYDFGIEFLNATLDVDDFIL